jgi:hypothetical protein
MGTTQRATCNLGNIGLKTDENPSHLQFPPTNHHSTIAPYSFITSP